MNCKDLWIVPLIYGIKKSDRSGELKLGGLVHRSTLIKMALHEIFFMIEI
jgi:hypothetical protein